MTNQLITHRLLIDYQLMSLIIEVVKSGTRNYFTVTFLIEAVLKKKLSVGPMGDRCRIDVRSM